MPKNDGDGDDDKQQKRVKANGYQAKYMKRIKEAAAAQPRNSLMINERPDFARGGGRSNFAPPPRAITPARDINYNDDNRRLSDPPQTLTFTPHRPTSSVPPLSLPPPGLFAYMPRQDVEAYYNSFRNEASFAFL